MCVLCYHSIRFLGEYSNCNIQVFCVWIIFPFLRFFTAFVCTLHSTHVRKHLTGPDLKFFSGLTGTLFPFLVLVLKNTHNILLPKSV